MIKNQLIIDGSQGEGGGQILRTSLSLATCLGQNIKIQNIRVGRKKSGLLRQHLTCVNASQAICNAIVTGAKLGSTEIEFTPKTIQGGHYRFAIGTAGSTNLVFQTILPALLKAEVASEVYFEGGTHNMNAPSFEFLMHGFLPILKKMNLLVDCELLRYGFYPKGGGQWIAKIQPCSQGHRLKLLQRGDLLSEKAMALIAHIPLDVSERELKKVAQKLNWSKTQLIEKPVQSLGSGNLLSLQLQFEEITTLFETVGQRGISAEKVANQAVKKLIRYRYSNAVVDEYLADQLLLPMALNQGGSFITHALSQHTKTNIDVINQFIQGAISSQFIATDTVKIKINPLNAML